MSNLFDPNGNALSQQYNQLLALSLLQQQQNLLGNMPRSISGVSGIAGVPVQIPQNGLSIGLPSMQLSPQVVTPPSQGKVTLYPVIHSPNLSTAVGSSPPPTPSSEGGVQRNKDAFTKTKMCKFFIKGQCKHGSSCGYAHSEDELRNRPNLWKTKVCTMYRKGQCFKPSDSCEYAHGRNELKATKDIFKTSLCRFWFSGTCTAGDLCRHAHGEHELRDLPADSASVGVVELEDGEEREASEDSDERKEEPGELRCVSGMTHSMSILRSLSLPLEGEVSPTWEDDAGECEEEERDAAEDVKSMKSEPRCVSGASSSRFRIPSWRPWGQNGQDQDRKLSGLARKLAQKRRLSNFNIPSIFK